MQEQLVDVLRKSGRFVVESAAEHQAQLGSDVTEYEEVRYGPNLRHNEYVIRLREHANSEMPVRGEKHTEADYAYRAFKRIVQ